MTAENVTNHIDDKLLVKFEEEYEEAVSGLGKCNVLVIGKTGVGKSTLINSVFKEHLAATGVGKPITKGIRQYSKQGCPITAYDTPGLELFGEKEIKHIREEVTQLIELQSKQDIKEHIHVVWYCINYQGKRFEPVEEDWIRDIAKKEVPVILVLTQTLNRKGGDFLDFLKKQNLPAREIIPVLAEPKEITDDYTVEGHGLELLVEVTAPLLPEQARKAFVREQIVNIDLKVSEAVKYLTAYTTGSALAGLIPGVSELPVFSIQVAMVAHITALFGVRFDKGFIKTVFSAITRATAGVLVGSAVLKFVPGIGSLASGVTSAGLTLALGSAYIDALKTYMQAQIKGEEIPLSTLLKIIVEHYLDYVRTGRKKIKKD